MKKFFSLIALVGVIAACTPEQIDTAFNLPGASGEITVEVLNLDGTAYDGTFNVSGFENFIGNPTVDYSGNKAVINFQLLEGEAILSPVDLTLKVDGVNFINPSIAKVRIPSVLAGGRVNLLCQVKVGELVGDYYFYEDAEYDPEDIEISMIGTLVNSHYKTHAYTHEGIDSWFINYSDQYLTGVVEYPYVVGYSAGYDVYRFDPVGFDRIYVEDYYFGDLYETTIDEWVEGMCEEDLFEDTDEMDIRVSGWGMWNVAAYVASMPITATLNAVLVDSEGSRTDDEYLLASVTYDRIYTFALYYELPYPGMPGHAHYEYGHGHGHGGENAGGGISINE